LAYDFRTSYIMKRRQNDALLLLCICLCKENYQRSGYEKVWHVSSDVRAIPSDKLSKHLSHRALACCAYQGNILPGWPLQTQWLKRIQGVPHYAINVYVGAGVKTYSFLILWRWVLAPLCTGKSPWYSVSGPRIGLNLTAKRNSFWLSEIQNRPSRSSESRLNDGAVPAHYILFKPYKWNPQYWALGRITLLFPTSSIAIKAMWPNNSAAVYSRGNRFESHVIYRFSYFFSSLPREETFRIACGFPILSLLLPSHSWLYSLESWKNVVKILESNQYSS
jgi:hypothetical protein